MTAHVADIGYVQLADNNRQLPGTAALGLAVFDAHLRAGYGGFAALEAWDIGQRPDEAELAASLVFLKEHAGRDVRPTPEVIS
jgi:sugar phosphate isomerase/epimerase